MADERLIRYGNQSMPMPDGMTLDQAKAIMARHFPELAENPKIETKKDGDKTTYVFSKQAGRKGQTNQKIITQLHKLKPASLIGESVLDYVLASGIDIDASEEQALGQEIARTGSVLDALLNLPPALPADQGVQLL